MGFRQAMIRVVGLLGALMVIVLLSWQCVVVKNNGLHDFFTQQQQPEPSRRMLLTMTSATNTTSRRNNSSHETPFLHDVVLQQHLSLFDIVPEMEVIGPTWFPKPTDLVQQKHKDGKQDQVVPILTPTHGSHRKDQDAVFIFAAEYVLNSYILFFSTLQETTFQGDVVVAVARKDWEDEYIRDFLMHQPYVVVYVIDYTCYNAEHVEMTSSKRGSRLCRCDFLYGLKQPNNGTIKPLPDPRETRMVQTLRFEIYWIWVLQYSQQSWILLLDARDSIFQSNPFDWVPRDPNNHRSDGVLIFFGENTEATRIGLSKSNREWIEHAYGKSIAKAMEGKPTICSGSTMGAQVAMETYLCAMVGEADDTGVKLTGSDQGNHNYLYYSNKLAHAETIRLILVQDQGFGIINNLGALRTKELHEWGNGKILKMDENNTKSKGNHITILNWDGSPSPIVHQFDRFKLLSNYFYQWKAKDYREKWAATRQRQQEGNQTTTKR